MWRMLPGRVYVARGYLPPGEHKVVVDGRDYNVTIQVDGQYALVPLRFYENSALQGDVGMFGKLPAVAPAPEPVAPSAAVKPVAKPTAKAPAKSVTKKLVEETK
jgi:hypothetical protein